MVPESEIDADRETVKTALNRMCPAEMRAIFGPMVEMAIMQIPPESISALARDLQNAMNSDGTPDMPKLIELGKQFGLTDEMIAGYQHSFAAVSPE